MSLAPGILVRTRVLRFGKIARALIECCVQIVDLNENTVRCAIVRMAAVIVGIRRKGARERIDPGARADLVLVTI